jgi:hypothetical protein
MNINNVLLVVVGLCVIVTLIRLDRSTTEFETDIPSQRHFIEYASILWKARVYPNEIEFVSNDRVFHTAQFDFGEQHVNSVSYRNLNGYFDPVLVTVWRRAQTYRALIIDPVREQNLLQVDADTEIDVSISQQNRILISHTKLGDGNGLSSEDHVVAWPAQVENNEDLPLQSNL